MNMNEIIENFQNLKFSDVIIENIFDRNYFQSMNTNLLSIQRCTQGINWTDLNRERIRNYRLSHFSGFRNNSQRQEEKEERITFNSSAKKDIFFQFSKIYKSIPVVVQHFQLRKNLIKKPNDVYYIRTFGIEKFNIVKNKRKMLVLFSGDEATENGLVVSFDVWKYEDDLIIACGKLNSQVALYKFKSSKEKEMSIPTERIIISELDSQIANCVKFIDEGRKLLICCNDTYVKIVELFADNKITNSFKADSAINHFAINNSQNIIAIVGDFETVNLYDYKSNNLITKLEGHADFGFSTYFRTNSDYVLASGNQDYKCKLWDIRKIASNSHDNNSQTACFKTLFGHFDAIGEMKFLNEDFLIYGENTDYLNIYNLNLDSVQTLEYFGKSIGIDVDSKMEKIYLGIEEENNFGIMTFDIIKSNTTSLNNLFL
jgi:WD40 repeat protein